LTEYAYFGALPIPSITKRPKLKMTQTQNVSRLKTTDYRTIRAENDPRTERPKLKMTQGTKCLELKLTQGTKNPRHKVTQNKKRQKTKTTQSNDVFGACSSCFHVADWCPSDWEQTQHLPSGGTFFWSVLLIWSAEQNTVAFFFTEMRVPYFWLM
jgi:hypothetical protein